MGHTQPVSQSGLEAGVLIPMVQASQRAIGKDRAFGVTSGGGSPEIEQLKKPVNELHFTGMSMFGGDYPLPKSVIST
jgi:hypothetical protein